VANADPLGYYKALNIGPGASQQEIRLAYKFLKRAYQEEHKRLDIGQIQRAYETLTDVRKKQQYDEGELRRRERRAAAVSRLNSVGLLIVLVVMFCLMLGIFYGPTIKARLVHFNTGDELVWSVDNRTLGTVLSYEPNHKFPNFVVAPAYKIGPPGDEEPIWYPARDLERYCSRK
jgi:hypothetical protein